MSTAASPRTTNRWVVLAVLCAALLVVVIDVTVLHVAAPSITEDLKPSALGLLWIIDIYSLVVAPLLVAFGTLGDRIGRRKIMVIGFVIFGVASAAAAFSTTTTMLIASRAVMGVGGAMILPGTMSILRDVFRDREERVMAVGIWSAVSAAGAAIGPILGGFLVQNWWWGAAFLINVPILIMLIPVTVRLLPESRSPEAAPWDLPSVILCALGVLGLALGIKQSARHGLLDPAGMIGMIAGIVFLAWFARRQLRARMPLLDIRLFATGPFSASVACVLLSMFALVGLELFFAQYLQLVLGLDPLDAALRLMPVVVATIVGGLIAAPLLRRLGTRILIAGGLALTTLSLVPMLALGVVDHYWTLVGPFIALGLGIEVALVAANDTIISSVPAERTGGASAIEETAYELGGGLGVAVLGSVMAVAYTAALAPIQGINAVDLSASRESLGRAVDVATGLPDAVATRLLDASREAFMHGMHLTLVVSISLLGFAAVATWFALRDASAE